MQLPMHIAILMANTDESDFAQRHPKDGEKFTALMSLSRPDWQYSTYRVKDGEFPADVGVADGYIITGSPASANEEAPWMLELEIFVRSALKAAKPIFGACFGHQIIAKAIGGHVGINPDGWVKGAVVARYGTENLAAYASHTEQVLELPNDAEAIATAPGCAIAGFRLGDLVETTQYHPEMTESFFEALLEEYGPKLPAGIEERAKASMTARPERKMWSERMVRFFENFNASHAARLASH